ncbi:MAG: 50S ribosomal protein L30 [Candidatus Actinomarina sp.]|jgi:large subunit ribosomal protein L30|nr:50S ribosomal protein L30 [Actinomycetota bacterium]MBL6832713.1 50S ribosomal protein L30 [Candidatus Actinomarina sp.]MBL6836493.1 50S ribosomal protein L30 [Candidatus Actinomarina sp.]
MKKQKLKEKLRLKMSKVKITLKRSLIGQGHKSRETIKSLGLKKINSTVERDMDDSLEGMLRVVNHLVSIEEV